MTDIRNAARQDFDQIIQNIADYALEYDTTKSELAMETARYCLMDSIACAMLALEFPACTKMLGPVVAGAEMQGGARVPGTSYELDPVQAAFNIGAIIRWLDYNDTWLAAEWGHPSDNLGAILAVSDYLNRQDKKDLTVKDVLAASIKAHEIQGVIALENAFNRVGLDHVMLVRIASTAASAHLLGCNRDQTVNAVSNAWIDGCSLRTYRHAPNAGSRKSWAAGDASARGVRLALIAQTGEMGYPTALSAPVWGFQDVLYKGESVVINRDYASYVMENILFKISYPAEFHAQTAVEASVTLHPQIANRLGDIKEVVIETQEAGKRIIDKVGALDNPADRDHCIQYMSAVALIKGGLTASDYEDDVAADPRIDALREKMTITENTDFTKNYHDQSKRAIGNAVQVFFNDGSSTERVEVEYPVGHRNRRQEGIPLMEAKFDASLKQKFSDSERSRLVEVFSSQEGLEQLPVADLMAMLSRSKGT